MSNKAILFLLFLYLLLVWALVALLSPRDLDIIAYRGLLWSAIGIGAVFSWLILKQVFGWWRERRARAGAAPAQPATSPQRQTPAEDTEFAALIAEADSVLARAPEMAQRRIRDFPIYLLAGPEGSGKTSLLHNSGIDARLLAGQVMGSGTSVSATRLANIWLANGCIFVEASGHVFESDIVRWAEFLNQLRPPDQSKNWSRFWRPRIQALQLRGVVLCCDLKSLPANADRMAIERSAHSVRDRLFKIAEIFRMRCPVYAMFTRADAIPYFAEFFDRLPDAEAGQPFGVLTAAENSEGKSEEVVWAEGELKKLNREFNNLFLCLSARRLLNLSYEPTASRKPAIYEFPREFKRIRTPLVQFLIDALRPDPLRVSPVLRGFFFCGTRKVEAAAGAPFETNTGAVKVDKESNEATRIFRADATQFMSGSLVGTRPPGGLVDKAIFTKDFFLQVLAKDRPPRALAVAADPNLERDRMIAVCAAAAVALLLSILWTVSWAQNRSLIEDANAVNGPRTQELSFENLRKLDSLRRLLVDRLDPPRPLSMNWGLYTGSALRDAARTAYFGRLQQLVLNAANDRLADRMMHADAASDSYDAVLGRLKTHLSITPANCRLDAGLVRQNLKQAAAETHPGLDPARTELINRQLDYYVDVLPAGNPVQLRADNEAIKHARGYLLNLNGPKQLYDNVIAEVAKGAPKVMVADHVPGYKQVISAPDEVRFQFTKDGQAKFEKLADSSLSRIQGLDMCVFGGAGEGQALVANQDQVRKVKSIYYRNYADAWKQFLKSTDVKRFAIGDTPQRLELLAGGTNPVLLQFLRFVSEQTSFPVQKPLGSDEATNRFTKALGLENAKQKLQKAAEQAEALRKSAFGPADVNNLFEPVHFTVPPDSPTLVTDKNRGYVDGLRTLKVSFETYIAAQPTEQATILAQLNQAAANAGNAHQSLADNFRQETEGVSDRLSLILLQPIQYAREMMPKVAPPPDPNAQLSALCKDIRPILQKYPFSRPGHGEATLDDVSHLFAPGTGKIFDLEHKPIGDLLVQKGRRWEGKPDAKPPVEQKLLEFLNQAQELSDALFAGGSQQPKAEYALRPTEHQKVNFNLRIDGTLMDSPFQKTFHWPAMNGDEPRAECNAVDPVAYGCGNYSGRWAVFKLFEQAHDRPLKTKEVTWTKMLTQGGEEQKFTPVSVDIVNFPGGADLFNPHFFDVFRGCPSRAVPPE
jgi:type VI secretion system protein ImpL